MDDIDILKRDPRVPYHIYLVVNNINGKLYVGMTSVGIERRWTWHCHKSSGKGTTHLARAIRTYGASSFAIKVIEDCATKEEACERERHWISFYGTMDRTVGYNMTEGGIGGRQDEEVRFRMGEKKRGKPLGWMSKPGAEEVQEKILASKGMKRDPLCGNEFFLTEVPVEEMKTLYEQGASGPELARRYGCSQGAILRRLKASGTPLRSHSESQKLACIKYNLGRHLPDNTGSTRTEETKAKMRATSGRLRRDVPSEDLIRLYAEGNSTVALSRLYNISHPAIRRRLTQAGVAMRKVGSRSPGFYQRKAA